MGDSRLSRREVPWCALFLVLGSLACHTCVLVGNLKTAAAMNDLGSSTAGWSRVGTGLSRALDVELDAIMVQVTERFVDSLQQVTWVQKLMDKVVSLIGNTTDQAIQEGAQTLLLQTGNTTDALQNLGPLVLQQVKRVLRQAMQKLHEAMDRLLVKIKPALNQVGDWMIKFGSKIQASIESFTSSLDKVQKVFDDMMSQLNGNGDNEDQMMHETFTLFDASGTNFVTQQDLLDVANLYSIQALQGSKAEELLTTYDNDGDGQLNRDEMKLFVGDASIPNVMSVVLRAYARKLSEVAGNIGAARMRDEVAQQVVRYLQLASAKNRTKVGWVCDALGNSSLPLDFTSAVYAQLCLMDGDPNTLTTADVGSLVIGTIYELHSERALEAIDRMSNATYWTTNGFNPADHSRCVRRVSEWIAESRSAGPSLPGQNSSGAGGSHVAASVSADGTATLTEDVAMLSVATDSDALQASLQEVERRAEAAMRAHLQEKQRARAAERAALFSSKTSQYLLLHLAGGVAAGDANPNAERAVNSGQPALPETRRFASWLSANASATAIRFQNMSFEYSSQSSSALDTFATQVQAMVKKIQGYIKMMMKWATPAGIDRLVGVIQDFVRYAETDLLRLIERKLESVLGYAMPAIADAVTNAEDQVADLFGHKIGQALGTPIASALKAPLGDLASRLLNDTELGNETAQMVAPLIGGAIANLSEGAISGKLKVLLDDVINRALSSATDRLQAAPSLLQSGALLGAAGEAELDLTDAWGSMLDILRTLVGVLPSSTDTLKFARQEVSKAGKNLNQVFGLFEKKGPQIFDVVAKFWSLIWVLYFIVLLPLTLFNLYYCLWSSGFFGGPRPIAEGDDAAPPRSWLDRLRICCGTCGVCMTQYHDTQCCFWSMIIFMQVIVLVIFIVSIVLCILAGIKAFITSGCSQIYILSDPTVCMNTIDTLRSFLSRFFVAEAVEELDNVCPNNSLLTCQLISAKMKSSMILTTVFSMLATLLSLQMLIESGILHEQARYRRLLNKMIEDDEGAAAADLAAKTG